MAMSGCVHTTVALPAGHEKLGHFCDLNSCIIVYSVTKLRGFRFFYFNVFPQIYLNSQFNITSQSSHK